MTASDLVTDSEIEKPSEWPTRTAASFNPFITSGSRGWAKYYADSGDLFIRITNLKRQRIKPDLSDRQHVALPLSEKEGLRTGLRQGDILISITADIGIIGYIDESVPTPAYINQHVACLRLPRDQVSPKFVAYYLASAEPQRRFIEMTDVGAKTGINLTTVGLLSFPCPPLKEQQAIAGALSDADALIEGLERLIAKKRLIKQGAMQDLLTARRRLPGFSGEWKIRRLAEIGHVKTGLTYSPDNVSPYGTLVLRSSNIQEDRLAFDDNVFVDVDVPDEATVHVGDLLICVRNGSRKLIGKTAMIDERADGMAFGAFMSAYRSDLNEYLVWCFQSSVIQKQVAEHLGATINQITNKTLKAMKVAMPVQEEERQAIASALNDMDAEIHALETRLEKARLIKEGMMQTLLTGRIRLVRCAFRG